MGRTQPTDASPLPEDPSLEDYVRLGLTRNAGLRAEFHAWQPAMERILQVTALPDPRLTYGHFVEKTQGRYMRHPPQSARLSRSR